MKEAKAYIIMGVILVLALLLKLNNWSVEYGTVEAFRGAKLVDDVFYPMIAKSINDEKQLKVTIDGAQYNNQFQDIYVASDKSIVVSSQFVKDTCNASIYKEGEDIAKMHFNGKTYTFPILAQNGVYYVYLDDLCKEIGYTYSVDLEKTTLDINTKNVKSVLPKSFDLRKDFRVPDAMNQGKTTYCWAYASILALETSVLPEECKYDVESMVESYDKSTSETLGGAFTNALAYLLSWKGPIEDNGSTIKLSGNDVNAVKHVQEAKFYTANDLDEIKWAVYKYGGVTTSIYADISSNNLNKSSHYKAATNSYCYKGDSQPNHEVVIIGWDDDYSASNFDANVTKNGAFICQNSWGKDFGNAGVFYVSYEDVNIGCQAVCYSRVFASSKYDNIYQSDLCGWKGQVGYGYEKSFGANVYEAKADEKLEAIGFYAIDKNATVNVYFVPEFEDASSLSHKELVATQKFDGAGYYTVEFDKARDLYKGQKFAVITEVEIPGAQRPLAIEYKAKETDTQVDIADGEGYISRDGITWESIEQKANGNLCLKAYTSNKDK